MNKSDDLVEALAPVIKTLERTGTPYYVGGSVASSYHGAARSTMDVDLVAELRPEQISDFIASLGSEYYVSEAAIRDAVKRKSCFNLVHLPTAFKVDIFVSRKRPFDEESMRRATVGTLGETRSLPVRIATSEDSIVSKLEWFRLTNETSERQWDDVSRLLKLLGDSADIPYLRRAAKSVGVNDLLERLLAETAR